MQNDQTYTLEQAKVRLATGGETSVVYAIPKNLGNPISCTIIAHGAGGPMYSPFVRFFHTELAKKGFMAIRFNFPYMEVHRKIPDRPQVLEASYRAIIEQAKQRKEKPSRIFIGGKSMGGRIASQVAASDPAGIDGLFFLGYPLHPPGRTDQLRDEHLYRIKQPMLFLSGTRDNFARRDLLAKVIEKIGPNAQLSWIEDGDHSFKTSDSKPGASEGTRQALNILLEWLERQA